MPEDSELIFNGDRRAEDGSEPISEYVQDIAAHDQGVANAVQDGTQNNYFMDLPDPRASTGLARSEEPEVED